MLKSNICLVKKNNSWVPKKEQQLSAVEKHGYTLLETLGEGAYAKVKLANSKKHNRQVAIKVINKRRAPKDFLKKFLPREVHLMHRLDHPNLIKLYEVVETATKVYLVMQLAANGDLLEHINNKSTLAEDEARLLFCQLAAAMAYCHKEHVVHRDLKCENILIDGDGKLCVTDFGFAVNTIKDRLLDTYCGSYAYCCPQILRGEPYDGAKADVWSMGVVLYAMTCARLPFSDDDLKNLIKGSLKTKLKFSRTISKECRNLVRAMLNPDQEERYSAEQVFRNPWSLRALKSHPELQYLAEYLKPVPSRQSSQRFSPCDLEEEVFPVTNKPANSKIGANKKLSIFHSFQATSHSLQQHENERRRHTISGLEIQENDGSRRLSLRNDLLRSLALKEMKTRSLQKIDDEGKAQPSEGYRTNSRRRSTLVSDVVRRAQMNETNEGDKQRKASLVSDVIKFDPKVNNSGRRNSLSTNQASCSTRRPSVRKAGKEEQLPGGRESREKDMDKLKYTSAAKAAKMAANEARVIRDANRRHSLETPEQLQKFKIQPAKQNVSNSEQERSFNAKFKNWQKKCQKGLNV